MKEGRELFERQKEGGRTGDDRHDIAGTGTLLHACFLLSVPVLPVYAFLACVAAMAAPFSPLSMYPTLPLLPLPHPCMPAHICLWQQPSHLHVSLSPSSVTLPLCCTAHTTSLCMCSMYCVPVAILLPSALHAIALSPFSHLSHFCCFIPAAAWRTAHYSVRHGGDDDDDHHRAARIADAATLSPLFNAKA